MKFFKPVTVALIISVVAVPSFASTFTYSCSGSISAVKLNTSSESLTVTMGSQSVQAYGNYKQSGSKLIWSGQAGYFEFDANKQRGYVEWGSKSATCRR